MSTDLTGIYDDQNIIAKLIRGELPISTVYEDERFLAFMDIFPESRGHVLVVPKCPARNFLDLPVEWVGPYLELTQRLTVAVEKALKPDGMRVMQYNGAEATQTIYHVHFHIVPCYAGVKLAEHATTMANRDELNELAAIIKAAI